MAPHSFSPAIATAVRLLDSEIENLARKMICGLRQLRAYPHRSQLLFGLGIGDILTLVHLPL